jgi:hypothetical protein
MVTTAERVLTKEEQERIKKEQPWHYSEAKASGLNISEKDKEKLIQGMPRDVMKMINSDYRTEGGLNSRYPKWKEAHASELANLTEDQIYTRFASAEAERMLAMAGGKVRGFSTLLDTEAQREVIANAIADRLEFHRKRELGSSIPNSIEETLKAAVKDHFKSLDSQTHERIKVGQDLEKLASMEAETTVAVSRQGLMKLPVAALTANYASTAPVVSGALSELGKINAPLDVAEKAVQEASSKEKQGRLDAFGKLLADLKASPEYTAMQGTALHKKVEELEAAMKAATTEKPFDVALAHKSLLGAAVEVQNSIMVVDPTTGKKQLKMDSNNQPLPESKLVKKFSSLNGIDIDAKAEGNQFAEGTYLHTVGSLNDARVAAETTAADARKLAVQQTNALQSKLDQDLKALAETEASKGDIRLKTSLENPKTVQVFKDGQPVMQEGKPVTRTVYPIFRDLEEAKFFVSQTKKDYSESFSKISAEVEKDIQNLDDKFISGKLEQAKLLEARHQAGEAVGFEAISREELDNYIKQANLSAESEVQVRQAAGYINFMYGRKVGDSLMMTGAEATAKAHYMSNVKRNRPDGAPITSGGVREFERLAVGQPKFSKQDGKVYSGQNLLELFNKRAEEGKGNLEAFDTAVSQTAAQALGDYTQGMLRIRGDFAGWWHRNATTDTGVKILMFAAGQWVGGQIFGTGGRSLSAGSGGTGGGNTNSY